jgi:hypothetical protein
MHADNWSSIVGLVALVGACVFAFRASVIREQLNGLRGDRDDLRTRVEILEDDKKRIEAELHAEKGKVAVLERTVTGADMLQSLQKSMELQAAAAAAQSERIIKALDSILEKVGVT